MASLCCLPLPALAAAQPGRFRTFAPSPSRRGWQTVRAERGQERKGESLWRKELQGSDGVGVEFGSDLQQDIERLAERREKEKRLESYRPGSNAGAAAESEKKWVFQDAVEKVLVLDFFFILFVLAWFLAGLGEKAALQTSGLIDAWFPLWPTVFQPALGVLMAGALASAASGWSARK